MWNPQHQAPEADRQQMAERQLLKQWQAAARRTTLEMVPFKVALHYQCRSLAATEEERSGSMDLPPVPLKPLKRIAKKMRNASSASVTRFGNWLQRRPCLQRLRQALIQKRRWLTVRILTGCLRLAARWQSSRK